MRERIGLGALAFGVLAPAVYLLQRLYERGSTGPGDPLSVVREAHVAFYWRAAIAFWLATSMAVVLARVGNVRGDDRLPATLLRRWPAWTIAVGALVLGVATLYP